MAKQASLFEIREPSVRERVRMMMEHFNWRQAARTESRKRKSLARKSRAGNLPPTQPTLFADLD